MTEPSICFDAGAYNRAFPHMLNVGFSESDLAGCRSELAEGIYLCADDDRKMLIEAKPLTGSFVDPKTIWIDYIGDVHRTFAIKELPLCMQYVLAGNDAQFSMQGGADNFIVASLIQYYKCEMSDDQGCLEITDRMVLHGMERITEETKIAEENRKREDIATYGSKIIDLQYLIPKKERIGYDRFTDAMNEGLKCFSEITPTSLDSAHDVIMSKYYMLKTLYSWTVASPRYFVCDKGHWEDRPRDIITASSSEYVCDEGRYEGKDTTVKELMEMVRSACNSAKISVE